MVAIILPVVFIIFVFLLCLFLYFNKAPTTSGPSSGGGNIIKECMKMMETKQNKKSKKLKKSKKSKK